jgi:hypothetical protein
LRKPLARDLMLSIQASSANDPMQLPQDMMKDVERYRNIAWMRQF